MYRVYMLYHGSAHKLTHIDPAATTELYHKRAFATSSHQQATYYARPKIGDPAGPQRHSRNPYKRAPQSRIQGYVHHVPEEHFKSLGGSYYATEHVVRPVKVETRKYSRREHPLSRNEMKAGAAVLGVGALAYGGYRLHRHFHNQRNVPRGSHNNTKVPRA